MLLELRRDHKEQQQGNFPFGPFDDTLLANGSAPFWAHRQLLLDDGTGAVLESSTCR